MLSAFIILFTVPCVALLYSNNPIRLLPAPILSFILFVYLLPDTVDTEYHSFDLRPKGRSKSLHLIHHSSLSSHSVLNNFTGFVLTACHTLIPDVNAAIRNNTITEFKSVELAIPEFTLNIESNKSLVSAYPP